MVSFTFINNAQPGSTSSTTGEDWYGSTASSTITGIYTTPNSLTIELSNSGISNSPLDKVDSFSSAEVEFPSYPPVWAIEWWPEPVRHSFRPPLALRSQRALPAPRCGRFEARHTPTRNWGKR